ncbi:MAG: FIST signal transduction protein [Candidatus Nanopelagicales bacterium]
MARADQACCAAALSRGLDVPGAVASALAGLAGLPCLAIVEVAAPADPNSGGRALAHAAQLIREVAPECTVIGSTAHGVIGPQGSLEMEPAVSVWLAHFPDAGPGLPGTRPRAFRMATVPGPHGGLALTGLPEVRADDRVAVLLADPWSVPLDDAVAAFARVDGSLPMVGGLVSGGGRRGDSRLVLDGAVFDNGAVGVILDGAAPVRTMVSQGCRPIGDPLTVTSAQGNAIAALAGMPALERVQEVLASLDPLDQALAARGLHIGIANDSGDGSRAADYVIRGILGVDAATGALAVGDEVPVGAVVRLHLRDADSADADLREVVGSLSAGTEPAGAYLVTCNGRGGAMFTTSDHDAGIVRAGLGTSAVAGFFAAGEIGPVGGTNHLHGFTAVVLVVDPHPVTVDVEVAREYGAPDAPPDDLDAELRALLGP